MSVYDELKSLPAKNRAQAFQQRFPAPQGCDFEKYDSALEVLIADAARDADSEMHSFLLCEFANHDDYYFIHKCIADLEPDDDSRERAVQSLLRASLKNRVRQPFWDVARVLVHHSAVRKLLEKLVAEGAPMDADNAQIVLQRARLH